MRNIHADIIHAYAEGAKVEWREDSTGTWADINRPGFDPRFQYRIKTTPKPDVVYYGMAKLIGELCAIKLNRVPECCRAIDNFRITFSGEDGFLKSAEVIS
jgi:hypothetical protein